MGFTEGLMLRTPSFARVHSGSFRVIWGNVCSQPTDRPIVPQEDKERTTGTGGGASRVRPGASLALVRGLPPARLFPLPRDLAAEPRRPRDETEAAPAPGRDADVGGRAPAGADAVDRQMLGGC